MNKLKAPLCSSCSRPLQRGRNECVYCGKELSQKEKEEVTRALTDEAVEKELKQMQAMLDASLPKTETKPRRHWFNILITILSLLIMIGFSWISEWNVVVIVLVVLFFSIPVWHVWRR